MTFRRAFRALTLALAALHLFPATKHLGAFFDAPSISEAWKGFGAIASIVLLLLAPTTQIRLVKRLAQRGEALRIAAFVLVAVHTVPALDHLPRFFEAPSFADAWRGFGSLAAILLFALAALRGARALDRGGPLALGARTLTRLPVLGFAVRVASAGLVTFGAASVLLAACGGSTAATSNGNGDGGVDPKVCPACVTDNDCANSGGGVCAQFGSDIYCAPSCANGESCSSDRSCTVVTTASGEQSSVCVPKNDACGSSGNDDAGPSSCGSSSSDAGDPNKCGTMVGPTEKSSCTSCTGSSSGGKQCQPNGCYGGWWCDTSVNKCHAPPTNCGGGSSGPPSSACEFDGGGPVTGTVGPTGGDVSRLYFAIVGDTRPASVNDTSGYPNAIITRIYSDIAALGSKPSFVVATGDYMFADPNHASDVSSQLDMYLAARGKFDGPFFPAMGNHECNGMTASNCGPGNTEGTTSNYTTFLSKLLGPLNQSKPYYSINVNAIDKSWTAKFVFVAANAWDAGQSSWLDSTLAQQTTYTFVLRHESSYANQAPGVTPSEQIMAAHPVTLAIVGHTHTYSHYRGSKQVIFGNGGAPLTGSANYGFGLVSQRSDGALEVDAIDYQSGQADPSFRFAIKADGTLTQ